MGFLQILQYGFHTELSREHGVMNEFDRSVQLFFISQSSLFHVFSRRSQRARRDVSAIRFIDLTVETADAGD